jgi:hypothetical protein
VSRAPLIAALAATALLAGCGGSGGVVGGTGQGPLKWAEEPLMFTPDTLPGDRVLTGYLRNDSVRRAPVFLNTFGKSLWSPGRGPSQLPDSELVRTGRIAFLQPGEQVPFTVAWHAADGEPMVVDYGAGSLRMPG